ncbi:MAG: hypothetical protein AB7O38_21700, partial [Pirellulaceae bacterium]
PKPPGTQDSKGSRDLDVEIVQPPTLYLVPQGSVNPLQVRPLITTAPAASGTVIVQRSDVEKRLEGLTRGVETLQKQMGELTAELKKLSEQLAK